MFVGKMLLLRVALHCLVPGFLYTLWKVVISRWGHLWCPPTLGLPFGTPQNDKLRHLNYVILTK